MPIEVAAYTPSVSPGPHQATCTDVLVKAAKSDPTNEFRVWTFTLDDGRTTSGSSSLSTSPKSKGGKWLAALLGRVPVAGESVEPIGRRCTIIVELDDNGYEKVTTVAPPEAVKPQRRTTPALEAEAAAQLHDDTPLSGTPEVPTGDLPF